MTAPYQQVPRTGGGVGGVLRGVLPASKSDLDGLEQRLLAAISKNSQTQTQNQNKIMKEISDLIVQAKANTDAEQSAILVLKDLHDRLVAAGTDPAAIAQIVNDLATSREALAAAIVANTVPA